jgi:YfiH family protein
MKEKESYSYFEELSNDKIINFTTNKSIGINYAIQSRDEIREILKDVVDFECKRIISPRQTHTNNVVTITLDNLDDDLNDCDGVITNLKGVALTIATADCQNILIYDPKIEVIANIHSGWKGTLNKILRNAIVKLVDVYRCDVQDLIVCIGPSILKCCFEVDSDVVDLFRQEFTDIEDTISLGDIKDNKQKYYIDTIEISRKELISLGVLDKNIITSNICTKCSCDRYHSYRAHGMDSGRNVSLIVMK